MRSTSNGLPACRRADDFSRIIVFKNPDKTPKQYTPGEALQKIAAFCAYQERNQKEVEQKLKSYGLDEDEAGEIIIRLSREKLLDEERFAQAFVRGHYRHKKWGRRRIMQELKQKGISEYCIKSGLKEIDGEEYYQFLVEAMEKKDRQEKDRKANLLFETFRCV